MNSIESESNYSMPDAREQRSPENRIEARESRAETKSSDSLEILDNCLKDEAKLEASCEARQNEAMIVERNIQEIRDSLGLPLKGVETLARRDADRSERDLEEARQELADLERQYLGAPDDEDDADEDDGVYSAEKPETERSEMTPEERRADMDAWLNRGVGRILENLGEKLKFAANRDKALALIELKVKSATAPCIEKYVSAGEGAEDLTFAGKWVGKEIKTEDGETAFYVTGIEVAAGQDAVRDFVEENDLKSEPDKELTTDEDEAKIASAEENGEVTDVSSK